MTVRGSSPIAGITTKSTKFDATSSIEAAAILGVAHAQWTPGGDTVNTFITGLMRKTTLDMGAGNDCVDPSHPIGGYDMTVIKGTGVCAVAFGHESKSQFPDTNTDISYFAYYKPSRDTFAADVTSLVLYDMDMDNSGITGTIGTSYATYQPRPGQFLALLKGGIEVNAKLIVTNYTLTRYDSMCRIMAFAGATVNVTVPATLPTGFSARVVQGDANKVTFVASGGNSILNYSSHTKTAGILASCDVDVYTSGSGGAVILSGNTSA